MTKINPPPEPQEIDDAIRDRVIKRARVINDKLFSRLLVVNKDLEKNMHRAALGGLDGIEREIDTLRSLLLLLQ